MSLKTGKNSAFAATRHAMVDGAATRRLAAARTGSITETKSRLQRIGLARTLWSLAARLAATLALRTRLAVEGGIARTTTAVAGRTLGTTAGTGRTLSSTTRTTHALAGAAWTTLALILAGGTTHAARRLREGIGVLVADVGAIAVRLVPTFVVIVVIAVVAAARFLAFARRTGFGWRFFLDAVHGHELAHGVFFQLFPATALQVAWQGHRAVSGTDQALHGQADGLEHAAHLAVAAFANDHAIPLVDAFAAAVGDLGEVRQAVVELDAGQQLLAHTLFQLAQRAHRVFAVNAVARVHQPVGQVARGGEQQQAFGVEVEAADGQPFAGLHRRQAVEHRWTAVRVVIADDFAGRLVVDQYARRLLADAALDQLAVDAHVVGRQDALADVGRLAVDGYAAGDDQLFHVAARTEAGLGQHLVQLRRVVVRGQVAAHGGFGQHATLARLVAVESVRGDEGKHRVGVVGLGRAATLLLRLAALAFRLARLVLAMRFVARTALVAWLGVFRPAAIGFGGGCTSLAFNDGQWFGTRHRRLAGGALFAHLARAARRTRATLGALSDFAGGGRSGGRYNCLDWRGRGNRHRRGVDGRCGLGGRLGARLFHWRGGVGRCCGWRGVNRGFGLGLALRLGGRRGAVDGGNGRVGFDLGFGAALRLGDHFGGDVALDCLFGIRIVHYSFLGCAQRQPLNLAQGREYHVWALHLLPKHRGRRPG